MASEGLRQRPVAAESSSAPAASASAGSAPATGVNGWLQRNVTDPVKVMMKNGVGPEVLALSLALGAVIGVFPVFGTTALLCGAAAYLLGSRVQVAVMMTVLMIASPIQIGLIVPFMRLGEYITRSEPVPLDPNKLWDLIKAEPQLVAFGLASSVLGWLVVLPVVSFLLYVMSLPLMRIVHKKLTEPESSTSDHPKST